MSIFSILFFLFGSIAIASALGILAVRNVIYAAFLLVVCLVSLAGIYVLFNATYLAVVQLLVYAGGVIILLAFGIMITNRSFGNRLLSGHHLFFPGVLAFIGLLFLLVTIYVRFNEYDSLPASNVTDIPTLGKLFMTDYILAFELIAYLLLVVLVGASYLAKASQE
jgi:NADH-quinone oxidoreductase subunit J